MKFNFFVSVIVALVLLSGCSSQFQQATQVDDQAVIQFIGDLDGYSLSINDQPIPLDNVESFSLNGETATQFSVGSGTHVVELRKGGQTLLKRKIYVSNGNVFEVRIP